MWRAESDDRRTYYPLIVFAGSVLCCFLFNQRVASAGPSSDEASVQDKNGVEVSDRAVEYRTPLAGEPLLSHFMGTS